MVELLLDLCKALDLILSSMQRKRVCIHVFMCVSRVCMCVCMGGKVGARNSFLIALQPNSLRQDFSIRSGLTHTAGLATILLWGIPSLCSKAEITVGLVLGLV